MSIAEVNLFSIREDELRRAATAADLDGALADCLDALDRIWRACGHPEDQPEDWTEPRHVADAVEALLTGSIEFSTTLSSIDPIIDQTEARGNARGARQGARSTPAHASANADESSILCHTPAGPAQNPAFSE